MSWAYTLQDRQETDKVRRTMPISVGFRIDTRDGDEGEVTRDSYWYLVIDTGMRLAGSKPVRIINYFQYEIRYPTLRDPTLRFPIALL